MDKKNLIIKLFKSLRGEKDLIFEGALVTGVWGNTIIPIYLANNHNNQFFNGLATLIP
jgi:hypothetical protein